MPECHWKETVNEQQPRLVLLFTFHDYAAPHWVLSHCESRALGLVHARCETGLVHPLEEPKLIDPACVRALEFWTSSSLCWRGSFWWRSLRWGSFWRGSFWWRFLRWGSFWRGSFLWRSLRRWSFRHSSVLSIVAQLTDELCFS